MIDGTTANTCDTGAQLTRDALKRVLAEIIFLSPTCYLDEHAIPNDSNVYHFHREGVKPALDFNLVLVPPGEYERRKHELENAGVIVKGRPPWLT